MSLPPTGVFGDQATEPPCPVGGGVGSVLPGVPGFEILSELGRGGMGVVYKAKQLGLNRLVALKMILAGPDASPETLVRFRAEAEAAAKLQHPNIVQIHHIGEHNGLPYFALEYVEGAGLDKHLSGVPQPPGQAAALVEVLARAMQEAHKKGIVHRDLKPANVLLSASLVASDPFVPPAVKITDFGLAKRLDTDSGQTKTGVIMGTPSYMAPEQAEAKHQVVGPAADIYALGAILYEMLTGRPPFRAPTPIDTLMQVVSDEPAPPSRLQSTTPRDLETICLKCLEKDPVKRYGAADALADDLRRFQKGEPIHARPVGQVERAWRWCRRNPVVAALTAAVAAALVVGTGVATYFAFKADARAKEAEEQKEQVRRKSAEVEIKAAESRRQVCEFCVTNGWRYEKEGDLFNAYLWFAEPLARDPDNPDQERMTRLRLAGHWNYTPRPRLLQLLHHDDAIPWAAFSPDGRRVVTCSWDSTARIWDAGTGQSIARFSGHKEALRRVMFSPDGKRVVTSSDDSTARVWDAATGVEATPPLGHANQLFWAAFSPDSKWIATASSDNTARLWNAATGQAVHDALQHQKPVLQVAFSPDSKRLATISEDRTARLWDVTTGAPIGDTMPHDDEVWAVAFSPDGRHLATGTKEGKLRFWNALTGELRLVPQVDHQNAIYSLAFSPDSQRLASASADNSAWVWDVATGRPVTRFQKHQHVVWSVEFSPDGRRVATASSDHTGRVFDAATGQPLGPPLPHQGTVFQATFSPDGRQLLTASQDKTARLWHLPLVQPEPPSLAHDMKVTTAAFSPDGKTLLTACWDAKVRLWDAEKGDRKSELDLPQAVLFAKWTADGRQIHTIVGDEVAKKGALLLWDAANGAQTGSAVALSRPMYLAELSPDGQRMVSEAQNEVTLWNTGKGEVVETLPGQRVNRDAFSRNGRRLVTIESSENVADNEQAAYVWDAVTGVRVARSGTHRKAIVYAALSPNGELLATASADNTARVWNASTGKPITDAIYHRDNVGHVAFSPDGRYIVTSSSDGTARVWDATTGRPVAPPLIHQAAVTNATFSAEGRLVATCSSDQTARVWETATGLPITAPLRHESEVQLAGFAPDGQRLFTLSGAFNVTIWQLAPAQPPKEDLLAMAHLWFGQQVDATGGTAPLSPTVQTRLHSDLKQKYPHVFSATVNEGIAWHRREGKDCADGRHWTAALFHFEKALALGDKEETLWQERGDAYANLGMWKSALEDFQKQLAGHDQLELARKKAYILLAEGQEQEYRRLVAKLLKEYAGTVETTVANLVAWQCALLSEGVGDWRPVEELAKRAAESKISDGNYLNTYGAVLYRAGRHQEAIQTLTSSIKNNGPEGDVTDWIFLAMAHHRLGHADEANKWLAKAVRWCESHRENLAKDDWIRRLEVERLRSEAEKLIKGKSATEKGQ
jgi:WD40 repeat protein/serine/threonine protein kinase